MKKNSKRVAIIGHITANKLQHQLVSNDEIVHPLTAQGWNAMRNNEN